ncbi:MAG: GyrI-like domain-containing protein [Oscillospiraceae bacterium]|nr:GyrI-like domain-containing protein [Oscillospiraceae bacterium]
MSEPAKKQKPDQQPESYSPKKKPEIVSLAEQTRHKILRRNKKMAIEPNIVSKRFTLVGAESKIDFSSDFGSALEALYQKVKDRLSGMQGLAQPARMVGYWYCPTPGSYDDIHYFAGVEADTDYVPEGLAAKKLTESLYAVFVEQERGQIGGPEGAGYKWLNTSKEYMYNEAIPGDLEAYRNLTDTAPDCEAEIYIPIKAKE